MTKKAISRRLAFAVTFLVGLVVTPVARGAGLWFGLGLNYNKYSLANISTGQDSIQTGLGGTAMLRWAIQIGGGGGVGGAKTFLEPFGTYTEDHVENPTTLVKEKGLKRAMGVGLDFKPGWFYVGLQYQWSKMAFERTGIAGTVDVKYQSLGLRGGLAIDFSQVFGVRLGGVWQNGVAYAYPNGLSTHQPVSQVSGEILFQYQIMGDFLNIDF